MKKEKNDFIKRLKELYPDYELISDYVNGDTFIFLKHKEGYIWKTKPRYLNGKRQCPEIAIKEKSKNVEKFTKESLKKRIKEKFGEDYLITFKSDEIKNQMDLVTITHKTCKHSYDIDIKGFLSRKKGCPFCYGKTARTKEEVNELFQLKEDLKDYECTEVFTKDGHCYGNIIHHCKKCNNSKYIIRISDMLSIHNNRCQKCAFIENESRAVKSIKKYLDENHINYEQEKKYKTCKDKKSLPFDFYLPEYNLIIEYDGIQHFKNTYNDEETFLQCQKHDKMKNKWCKENNKDLLRIKYTVKDPILYLENYLNENYEIDLMPTLQSNLY